MIRAAIDAFRKMTGKRQRLFGGLVGVAVEGVAACVPGVGLAAKIVGELASHGAERLLEPDAEVPDVKAAGESFPAAQLDQINAWLQRLTEAYGGLVDRLEVVVELQERDSLADAAGRVKQALLDRPELARAFDACLHEVRSQTLSLARIEERLDEHFHVQHRLSAGLEDIKAMFVHSPLMGDWAEFRKARPDALQAVNAADEHFLAGRRDDGVRELVGLLRERGVGSATLARHLGLVCVAHGRVNEARAHLESAEAAGGAAEGLTSSLKHLSTLSGRGAPAAWRSLRRGTEIDRRYAVEVEVGRGGMASVYRAVGIDRINRGKVVALKVPAPGLMDDDTTLQRFVQEIEISQKLSAGRHPAVVQTLGYVHFDDPSTGKELYGLVLEYVDGQTLAQHLAGRRAEKKLLAPKEIADVLKPVCEALEFAHGQSPPVLHRDLKAHNVLLGKDGSVRLTDFGIARVLDDSNDTLTRTGQLIGTFAYMPPELFTPGAPVDARTDIYMLGNLLLELLTFSPTGDAEGRADCPPEWLDLIADAMNRVRAKRPPTVREFLKRLQSGMPMMPTAAAPPPPAPEPVPELEIPPFFDEPVLEVGDEQPIEVPEVVPFEEVPLPAPAPPLPAPEPAIRFRCTCGKRLRAKPEHAGKRVRCPFCGSRPEVPVPGAPAGEPSGPAPVVVDTSGRGDCKTVAEALRKVPAGGRILIKPGVYREAVVLDQEVELVGEGRRDEIVLESGSSNCVRLSCAKGTLRNLTLRQKGKNDTLYAATGVLTAIDCDITADRGTCITVTGTGTHIVLKGCRVRNAGEYGIFICNGAEGTIENSEVIDNARAGVETYGGSGLTLRDSKVRRNGYEGVRVSKKSRATIENNDLSGNKQGPLYVESDSQVSKTGNKE